MNEVSKVVDTMMSIPTMGEKVKLGGSLSRKNVLLLSSVIARGLGNKEEIGGLADNLAKDAVDEILAFSKDCLEKAGLVEFSEKLKSLTVK